MANWFQQNPAYTIIGHTILIATTTWVISSFVIDENKVNLYKAKAENAETITAQYSAKISILELELNQLRIENQRYLSWLSQEPRSIPALEKKIVALESQLAKRGPELSTETTKPPLGVGPKTVPYEFSIPFLKGESFVDPKTKATIGVSSISPDYTVTGIVYLPGDKSIEIRNAKPGATWEFDRAGTQYKLTLESVNWLNDSLRASVIELGRKESNDKKSKPIK